MNKSTDNYNEIIVIGPNSSLAKFVLQELSLNKLKLFGIYNNKKDDSLIDFFFEERLIPFSFIKENHKDIQRFVPLNLDKNVLILNFSGSFGEVNAFTRANPTEIIETMNSNFEGFIYAAKILSLYNSNSLMISFCGAGVGGGGLDDSSLGYLSAKSGLVLLNEALDNQLMHLGLRLSLISPGAFPSQMQNSVATAPEGSISSHRREQAKNVVSQGSKHPEKIIEMLNSLISNPETAGGRLWSAQHDNFHISLGLGDFGKLRRQF
jgi:hypothetical protein